MQHQRGNHTARYTSDEVLVLAMAQHRQKRSDARRTAGFDRRRHFNRVKFLVVRYRSVGGKSSRVIHNASNVCLHSATYLLICGRQCRYVYGSERHGRIRL